jgi:DNA-binding SARP family transcriptional activator
MLFEHADDPRGALRWNLAEMRRALGGLVSVGRDPLTFAAQPDVSIDVVALADHGPARTTGVPHGELLEGLSFDDSPAFDAWLSVERHRLAADCRALAYRWSVELLANGRPEAAARVAVQAVESDRLNTDLHAVRNGRCVPPSRPANRPTARSATIAAPHATAAPVRDRRSRRDAR